MTPPFFEFLHQQTPTFVIPGEGGRPVLSIWPFHIWVKRIWPLQEIIIYLFIYLPDELSVLCGQGENVLFCSVFVFVFDR